MYSLATFILAVARSSERYAYSLGMSAPQRGWGSIHKVENNTFIYKETSGRILGRPAVGFLDDQR